MMNLRPMLLTRGEVPLDSREWAYEVKWDGMRALSGGGRLVSRHGTDCTAWFPELRPALEALPEDSVFDGEIVSLVDNRPNFAALRRRILARGRLADCLAHTEPVLLILFDVLRLDGRSMTGLPWHARREALEWGAPQAPRVEVSPVEDDGEALWRMVERQGWEGIVAKRRDAVYRPGERSKAWVKVKTTAEAECVVGGWVESPGGGLGALVVGEPNGGALAYRGHVGFGFRAGEREALGQVLALLETERCPFSEKPPRGGTWARGEPVGPVHWTTPELRVRVKSYAGAGDGLFRDPVFTGFREG